MPMKITSPVFSHDGEIPTRYTCEGEDVSPPLEWSGVPEGTKSLALIVDDPDAPDPGSPNMTWVHWLVYNIPPDANGLPEKFVADGSPRGIQQGINDWLHGGYEGPCPPIGKHRYFFKLYALDTVLPNLNRPTKNTLEGAMQGHIIAHTQLVGRYQRH